MYSKLRAIRNNIPFNIKEEYAIQLAKNFKKNFPNFQKLSIGSYKPTREEISPKFIDYFLKEHNTLFYPVLHPFKQRSLWFSKACGVWIKNKYQFLEPKLSLKNIIAPWLLDAVIVPLLGFDHHCNRIGMGGGYYDMSFAFKQKFSILELIGIAFDEQQVDSIKINYWDVPMDIIVTPTQIFRKNFPK